MRPQGTHCPFTFIVKMLEKWLTSNCKKVTKISLRIIPKPHAYLQSMVTTSVRATIKNCWFAVLLPTRQNWPYPKNFMAILRFFFVCFFQKSKNNDSFSQNYSFQNLFYVLTMFILYCFNFNTSYFEQYTSTNIANYKDIFLVPKKKKKKKKRPTYLPTLKLMGRSTANKESFKDGLKFQENRNKTVGGVAHTR